MESSIAYGCCACLVFFLFGKEEICLFFEARERTGHWAGCGGDERGVLEESEFGEEHASQEFDGVDLAAVEAEGDDC